MNDKDRKSILAAEQAAVDQAYDLLERGRSINEGLQQAPSWSQNCPESDTPFIRDAPPELKGIYDDIGGQSLVVARVEVEYSGEKEAYHIGRRTVKDPDTGDRMVINWSSKMGTRWLLSHATQPGEVLLRRRLRCNARRLISYADDIDRRWSLAGASSGTLQEQNRPTERETRAADDFLIEEINRGRGDRMRDIVATIGRDQLKLVANDPDGVFIVQGGPGTGKTALGLHRIAWLLDPDNRTSIKPGEILMVVPHMGLLDYVDAVPRQLGVPETTVRALDHLWSEEAAGSDALLARWVKSDERMAQVLHRALENTVRLDAVATLPRHVLTIKLLGGTLRLSHEDVSGCLAEAFNGPGSFQTRRAKAKELLLDRLMAPKSVRWSQGQSDDDTRKSLERNQHFKALLSRLWPAASAPHILRQLYSSKKLLAQASAGLLLDEERASLHRDQRQPLTPEDLVCLDELRYLISGDVPHRYRHLVIDEAQNLTPMQARAMARRCPSGSITVLGDLAQATGPHLHRSWDEIADLLSAEEGWTLAELTTGYRTPREVIDFVAPLAEAITPDISVPKSVRPPAQESMTVHSVVPWKLLYEAAVKANNLAHSRDEPSRSVALVVPDDPRWIDEAQRCLIAAHRTTADATTAVRVLPAAQTKGMEFDHVVVVEPTAIIENSPAGLNQLYVALTRCTQTLTIIHAAPLPSALGGAYRGSEG